MSEWIEWKGGDCPVVSHVRLKARCGAEWEESNPEDVAWYHGVKAGDAIICDSHPMDIIAYRPSKAPDTHKVNG